MPGISRFSCSHGTHVSSCAHMEPVRTWNPLVCKVCTECTDGEQCAQCAQKNANCIKNVHIVTIMCTLFTKYFRHVSAASRSQRCPGNRQAALTRPMGRWGGRWFGKSDAKGLHILLRYDAHPRLDCVSSSLNALLCARYST